MYQIQVCWLGFLTEKNGLYFNLFFFYFIFVRFYKMLFIFCLVDFTQTS